MKTATLKLNKAITQVLINHPFYASILLHLDIKEDDDCKTLWVDGKTLGYNPNFIEEVAPGDGSMCILDTLVAALLHEIQHIACLHHFRRKGRDFKYWNIACDHAINLQLKAFGYSIPDEWLADPQFANLSEEEIYERIYQPSQDPYEPPESGEVRDHPDVDSEDEDQALQQTIQQIQQAILSAKRQGLDPTGQERILEDLITPKPDLWSLLHRFIQQTVRRGYDYRRPNRRYPHFYLPRRQSKQLQRILVALDTSGSIDNDLLQFFVDQVRGVLSYANKRGEYELDVVCCDATIQTVQTLTSESDEFTIVGGGGTSYAPVMDYLQNSEQDYRGLIYLTDGECDEFGDEPNCPVLWVLTQENRSFRPPFGEVHVQVHQ